MRICRHLIEIFGVKMCEKIAQQEMNNFIFTRVIDFRLKNVLRVKESFLILILIYV